MQELHDIQKASGRLLKLLDEEQRTLKISEILDLCADALTVIDQERAIDEFKIVVGTRRGNVSASGRTAFGAWAQWVRRVHGLTLGAMATELTLGSARLSGYECGREAVPEGVILRIERLYGARFKI